MHTTTSRFDQKLEALSADGCRSKA